MKETDPRVYDEWYLTPFGALCHRLERDALFSLAAFKPGELVLDAGCGTGVYLKELADIGVRPVGLDKDPKMLDAAKIKLPGAPLVEADLSEMPFKAGAFGKAVSVCALEFVQEPCSAFREFKRVISQGGALILGFLNINSPWARARLKKSEDPGSVWHGVKFWSLSEVERVAARSGLRLSSFRTAVHFPPEAKRRSLEQLEKDELSGLNGPHSCAAFIAVSLKKE